MRPRKVPQAMDRSQLSTLPPGARHIVDNLSRVVPQEPASDRQSVVWLCPYPDRTARLAEAAASLKQRFPADRFDLTVVLPAASLLPYAAAVVRSQLIGMRLLEVSDAVFVQQMCALTGGPFEVEVDGRLFVHQAQRWFLSVAMSALMAEESNVDYVHRGELQVEVVRRGVVHPLERSATGQAENRQYGGVTDEALNFVELSATERVNARRLNAATPPWYTGANPACRPDAVAYIDEDVVFLGPLSKHYGHFILEGIARLWYFLDADHLKRYKAVYIAEPGMDRFNDLFTFFGLPAERLIRIDRPTAFRTVVVPEQSMRLQDRCHPLYKATINRITLRIPPGPHRKVYFSKEMRGNYRGIGEKPMEDVFVRNGYELFYPERLSMFDTLSILKGCESFAASSGTNAHNAVFLNDGAQCISLNRSPHVHPVQTQIDRMKGLDAVYVEAHVSLLPADWSVGPFLFGPTRHVMAFFDHQGFAWERQALQAPFPHYLAEFMKIWGLFYNDPRRQAYLEPQEQTVAFIDLVASVVDTFLQPAQAPTASTAPVLSIVTPPAPQTAAAAPLPQAA